ncbi:hypothetical protein P0092_16050 [Ruminiclostridium papyrosolvens DSM 2782]|uniref:hypothetical protein n=1 Tax=Ruminiclostridium papyrosolvens TaxID=29362 RepID=UPI0002DB8319|nr:hypothetical protein [Ruminiclostridium papyrosolvens]WES33263.1 hypothetical protein P0092_16050 [Ruminiclostridium papyrosolvens DSM 2782]
MITRELFAPALRRTCSTVPSPLTVVSASENIVLTTAPFSAFIAVFSDKLRKLRFQISSYVAFA